MISTLIAAKRAISNAATATNDSYVISYRALRILIGIIGIALPFALVFGKILFDGPGIQSTISDYYYTSMRDYFVGSLCAIGIFMTSYRGPQRIDQICGVLACIFAIGVALFPTTPELDATSRDKLIGAVHVFCAACLFLTMAFFSLVLFRKTFPNTEVIGRKRRRNGVYWICGGIILVCIAGALAVGLLSPNKGDLIFYFEFVAVFAFGFSWLTKAEALPFLWDEKREAQPVPAVVGEAGLRDKESLPAKRA